MLCPNCGNSAAVVATYRGETTCAGCSPRPARKYPYKTEQELKPGPKPKVVVGEKVWFWYSEDGENSTYMGTGVITEITSDSSVYVGYELVDVSQVFSTRLDATREAYKHLLQEGIDQLAALRNQSDTAIGVLIDGKIPEVLNDLKSFSLWMGVSASDGLPSINQYYEWEDMRSEKASTQ